MLKSISKDISYALVAHFTLQIVHFIIFKMVDGIHIGFQGHTDLQT